MDLIEQLLNYQEVDEQLKTIEDALKGSDEFKKYAQATKFLKTVDDSRVMFEDRSKSLLSNFSERKKQLSKLLEEMAELESSINDEVSEKEVAYLTRKSNDLLKRLNLLETEVVKYDSEIKDLLSQYNTFVKKTKVALEQRKEYKEKYEKLAAEKEEEMKEISARLHKMESEIPAELMEKYKEKRKDGKFKIVCKVHNGYCTSCNTELVIADKEKLKAEKIIECPNCHKLIYLE